MTEKDKIAFICWGISIIISLIFVVISIIKKDKDILNSSLFILFVSLTPFGVLLPIIVIICCFIICCPMIYDYLINKLTKNWK